ncbi:MAG: VTT domain-containing protein, partial [Sphaerochaetaceae bacterium]|nr:VTT domain-containing protein [Sphaerochaetaceae bacterium]
MDNKQHRTKSSKLHLFNISWFKEDGNLDWRQIIFKAVLLMLFFLIIYAIGLYFVRNEYQKIGSWVSSNLGLSGIALFTFLTDMLIVPMSVDIVFPFVLNWDPVPLLLTMALASAVGGYCGYWIGRLFGKIGFIRRITSGFSDDGERLVNKYGVWAVVIAGLTPIPFSTVCWISGMLKVHLLWVALATISRLPRMIIYFAILKGGLFFLF